MDDLKPEGIVAILIAMTGTAWAAVQMFFNLKARVDRHDERIRANEAAITGMRDEIRGDMKRIDSKLDRLIERRTAER